MNKRRFTWILAAAAIASIAISACEDFVQIGPPETDLVRSTVFSDQNTANAATLDLYYKLSLAGFASGDIQSISFLCALSADDLLDLSPGGGLTSLPFNQNALNSQNTVLATVWSLPYSLIYESNSVIEGLAASTGLSDDARNQFTGEAKFIRAFCHFYLVNLFGDVPLVLTTNYVANANAARTPKDSVIHQIIADLVDAQNLLPADYAFAGNQRIRANKWVATALLARAYLYNGEWANAETQATSILTDNNDFNLLNDLNQVFYSASTEAIWQLATINYPPDLSTFFVTVTPGSGVLSPEFLAAFESNDQRRIDWVDSVVTGTDTYYFPTKYKSQTPKQEFSTVLRLAEQFLIRAEARAQLNNLAGSAADLNAIRLRANLNTVTPSSQTSLLSAIGQERRVELFTEWGHRWFDLKRTGQINAVLAPVKSGWKSSAALFPIPEQQLLADPAMNNSQNPGY